MHATIEKLIYGGDGLARAEGGAIFVPFSIPGEEAEIEIVEQKKKFQRGEIRSLLKPSPHRTAALCPYFTRCGGCQYQHIGYEAQLGYKEEILRETLRRTGGIDWTGKIAVHSSPAWRYRNRAQWRIRPADETRGEPAAIGYLTARSSLLCPVEQCPILSPLLEKTLAIFHQWLREADDSGERAGQIREIEAFADHADENILLNLKFSKWPANAQDFADEIHERMPYAASILFRDKSDERAAGFGNGWIEYRAAGSNYRTGHDSFFQVNRFLVDTLAERVALLAGDGGVALDLFAGVGLFSLILARKFKRVVAVEANPPAAEDLRANADATGGRIQTKKMDVTAFLRRAPRDAQNPDVIVADPPRSGIPAASVQQICKLRPRRIIYVSCEPSTLARDLAAFREGGYAPAALELFDNFPQTFHIESATVLEGAR